MINQQYKAMLGGKSIIRELSEYANARGEEIGYENVFDFSLGNPSVPCPKDYTEEIIRLHEKMNPMALHGYSPVTHDSVREKSGSGKSESAVWYEVYRRSYFYDHRGGGGIGACHACSDKAGR